MRRGLIAIALTATILLAGCASRNIDVSFPETIVHRAVTDDGWYVSLIHLEPTGPARNAPPLILCHGITSTAYAFDLRNGQGLGPYLAAAGYDVWMLNLRGRAESAKPTVPHTRYRYDWDFDDYLNHDLPAAIQYVQTVTGSSKVTWLGHSMGGMLMYAYLGKFGQKDVDKAVFMACPVTFSPPDATMKFLTQIASSQLKPDEGLYVEKSAKALTGVIARKREWGTWVINPDNFSEETTARYVMNSVPNLSAAILLQVGQMARTDRFTSRDGAIDYREGIRKISIPALVLTGKADNLAPTWGAYPGYANLASSDKTFLVLGQANGCREDHGHGGIILGDNVEEEVYAVIRSWLDNR